MTARWYHADVNGTFHEITDRVARVGWEIREQAEEGESGMSTVTFDDPDMDFDPEPWRNWYVLEDESEDANSMLCGGWTAEQEVGREGGEWTQPLGRVWQIGHTDANTYWAMRVMVGADANRPAETDVERVQWLMGTSEMAWALDVTTYVSTASPVAMDAVDYRGKYLTEIMSDCSQPPAGKNWYAWIDMLANVRTVTVWYGKDTLAVRDSALSLSNDPDDWTDATLADGTSLVWPISSDTKLKRDPSRMYDGVYLEYDGGAVYRDTDPRTVRRDFISPNALVKTSAKATARANGYLGELAEQDEIITTSVELPAAKATMIRAGMRVKFRATHLPGYSGTPTWCRVLSCSVSPVAAGERYRLTLEVSPMAESHVQFKTQRYDNVEGKILVLDWKPTEGHTLVMIYQTRNYNITIEEPTGWTQIVTRQYSQNSGQFIVLWKIAGPDEDQAIHVVPSGENYAQVTVWELAGGAYLDETGIEYANSQTSYSTGTLVTSSGGMLIAIFTTSNSESSWDANLVPSADPDWTTVVLLPSYLGSPSNLIAFRDIEGGGSWSYTATIHWVGGAPYADDHAGLTLGGGATAIVLIG